MGARSGRGGPAGMAPPGTSGRRWLLRTAMPYSCPTRVAPMARERPRCCVGAYAGVARAGRIRVGEILDVQSPPHPPEPTIRGALGAVLGSMTRAAEPGPRPRSETAPAPVVCPQARVPRAPSAHPGPRGGRGASSGVRVAASELWFSGKGHARRTRKRAEAGRSSSSWRSCCIAVGV